MAVGLEVSFGILVQVDVILNEPCTIRFKVFPCTNRESTLNEILKNVIRRRDIQLGWVLLALIAFVMVAANRFVFMLTGMPVSEIERYISYSLSGVVMAEFALLAVWTVLISQPFLRRIQFLVFASVVLLAAWLLGYVTTFSGEVGINWANDQLLYYLGFLPLIFLGVALPLIVLRFFFSRVLTLIHDPQPPFRQPVTTGGLMMATAIVAFVLATVQLPALIGVQQADIWRASGMFAGIGLLISLVVVLPWTMVLCSSRRNFFIWSFVSLATTLFLTVGVMAILLRSRRSLQLDEILIPAQIAGTAMFVFLMGIAALRLFGYRLTKSIPSRSKLKQ